MEVNVNFVAILLAALSTMVVGSIWYTPKVFGNTWMRLAKVQPKNDMSWKQAAVLFGGAFLASLVTAYVLATAAVLSNDYFGNSFLEDALTTGLALWLGFTAARLYMHDSFEGRRKRLTILNAAHELVTIGAMALIIGLFGR